MPELVETLTAIHRRFESMRFVSQPAIHVINHGLGVDIDISSRDSSRHHFIASATKPMLAVAVVRQLALSGLTLDTALTEILPDEMRGVPYSDQLTVRHLLTHTSGMFDYWSVHGLAAHRGKVPLVTWANNHPGWSIDDVVELARTNRPAGKPGQRFAYCGTNYQFATRVIEQLSGLSAAEAFDSLVFSPSGMTNTYLFTQADLARFDSVSTVLLRTDVYEAGRRMASLGGEGAVVSTLSDTNRFMNWVERGDAIPRGWMALMTSPRQFSPGIEYGLGVMQVSLPRIMTGWTATPTTFGHYGMTGYAMMSDPASGWQISTTVNQMSRQLIGVRLYAKVLQSISRYSSIR